MSGHAILDYCQAQAAPSCLVTDKSSPWLINRTYFLRASCEMGLEADILVVRLGLTSLAKALFCQFFTPVRHYGPRKLSVVQEHIISSVYLRHLDELVHQSESRLR